MLYYQEKRVPLSWKDHVWLAGNGVLAVSFCQIIVFLAVQLVGAGVFGMLIPLTVIFTAVLSSALGMEPPSLLKVCLIRSMWLDRASNCQPLAVNLITSESQ